MYLQDSSLVLAQKRTCRGPSLNTTRKDNLGEFVLLGRNYDHTEPEFLRERQKLLRYGRFGGVVGGPARSPPSRRA
jgi:hypothetical protein